MSIGLSYDAVISSNHAFAKGVITRPDQMHISYIHTPMRYAWELQHEYLRQARLTRGPKGMIVRMVLHYLRAWDRMSADRVDAFIANSHYIAQRVRKTYRRPALVVYPPVDVDSFTLHSSKDDFYLAASRLVPYKRIDLIVEAFARMPDRHLVVIGDGTEYEKIAAKATSNVTLLGDGAPIPVPTTLPEMLFVLFPPRSNVPPTWATASTTSRS